MASPELRIRIELLRTDSVCDYIEYNHNGAFWRRGCERMHQKGLRNNGGCQFKRWHLSNALLLGADIALFSIFFFFFEQDEVSF